MDRNLIGGFKYGQKSYSRIQLWTENLLQDSDMDRTPIAGIHIDRNLLAGLDMDRNLIAGFRYGHKSYCRIQIWTEILLQY